MLLCRLQHVDLHYENTIHQYVSILFGLSMYVEIQLFAESGNEGTSHKEYEQNRIPFLWEGDIQ